MRRSPSRRPSSPGPRARATGMAGWIRRLLRRVPTAMTVAAIVASAGGVGTSVVGALLLLLLNPTPAAAAVPNGFEDTLVTKVSGPTALAFTPDGRMLITSHFGTLWVYQDGALRATPALDYSQRICSDKERGLLGVTVDPGFASDRFIYLYYTYKKFGVCEENPPAVPSTGVPVCPVQRERRRPSLRGGAGGQHPPPAASTTPATCTSARTATSTSASATAAATSPRRQRLRRAKTTLRGIWASCPARCCASPRRRHPRRQPIQGAGTRPMQRRRAHYDPASSAGRSSPGACATRSASPSTPTPPAPASSSTTSARTPGRRSTTAQAGADYGWNMREGHCASGLDDQLRRRRPAG